MVSVFSYADSSDVAAAVARHVVKIQNEVLKTADFFHIAVSGGSMGKVLRSGLIDNEEAHSQIKWDQWKVYFSDERIVPLDHPDSNYGALNEFVLKPLAEKGVRGPTVYTINESLVHETDTKTDSQIAEEYASFIPKQFDLILLGCGPDGHTCSLFPGHPLLKEETLNVAAIADSPKPPPRRITLTFPVLKAAREIAFIAEGAGKAAIFKEIFGAEKTGLPCELVNGLGVPVSWFTNDAALEGVPVTASKY
ncbi:6-phosphogluconolactonase 3 [Cyberlindnera fabianii]|nr:6-phosphogluconolactonase 3 [Cyberlindnera fabianii]